MGCGQRLITKRAVCYAACMLKLRITPMLLLLLALGADHVMAQGPPVGYLGACAVQKGDRPAWQSPAFDDSAWPVRPWQDLKFDTEILWLRCPVVVADGWDRQRMPIGLFINGTFSAEVWWDGQAIGSKGTVGHSPATELAGPQDTVVFIPPDRLAAGAHLIAIRVSAQHAGWRINTPIDGLYLARYRDASAKLQAHYRWTLSIAGALVLAALVVLAMGFSLRDRAFMFLGLATLGTLAQLGFEVSRAFISYDYPWHTVRLLGVAAAAAVAGFGFLSYLCCRFRQPHWITVPLLVISAAAWVLVPILDIITVIVIATTLLLGMLVSLRAWWCGHTDARISLFALLAMMGLLALDLNEFLDTGLFVSFALLLLVFFADHTRAVMRTRQRAEQAARTASRLELELLKRHLRPHFLMNTLTSLSEWVETSPAVGVRMIEALSAEFQILDRVARQTLIALSDEVDLCRRHLTIMGFRHDRVFTLDAAEPLPAIMIPPAVLHTLVENAVTHGSYRQDAALLLSVSVERKQATISLHAPPGHQVAKGDFAEGTGLSYVRARLAEAFGENWTLQCGPGPSDGWRTVISIPAVPVQGGVT